MLNIYIFNICKETRSTMVAAQGAKVALKEVEKGNGTHAPPPKASPVFNRKPKG
jgi:hypothetical protein